MTAEAQGRDSDTLEVSQTAEIDNLSEVRGVSSELHWRGAASGEDMIAVNEHAPDGVGGADLSVSAVRLNPVADAARGLYDDLSRFGCAAEDEVRAAASEFNGVGMAAGAALTALGTWWRRQCDDLLDDCARISGHLDYTIRSHEALEDDLRASFQRTGSSQSGEQTPITPASHSWGHPRLPGVEPNWDLLRAAGVDVDAERAAEES